MVAERKIGPNRGNAGKGRPKGAVNKTTATLKDMILTALEGAHPEGGAAYLREQAAKNPNSFMTLVGKVLPLQVGGDPDGVPIALAAVDHRRLSVDQLRAIASIPDEA